MPSILVDRRFQGPTGSGQGGYTAGLAGGNLGRQFQADFHRPIPLDTPLRVADEGSARLVYQGEELVMKLARVDRELPTPPPVDLAAAEAARAAYPTEAHELNPHCFSCGVGEESMRVWAGPVGGGEFYATPWVPPAWTDEGSGTVALPYIWAAIDCPAGAKACLDDGIARPAVTGSMTAEVLGQVTPCAPYVIVAWAEPWRGRRRISGAGLFDTEGQLVARQASLWISVRS